MPQYQKLPSILKTAVIKILCHSEQSEEPAFSRAIHVAAGKTTDSSLRSE
jgi:hypothetical protein